MDKFLILISIIFSLNVKLSAQTIIPEKENSFNTKPEFYKILDDAGQKFVDDGYLSGGVSMIAHNGKIIYEKAFGMQSIEDGQSMQLNSLFRIASMTKPIIVVAVLLLVDEGKLSLDDEAGKYLPQLSEIKVLDADGNLKDPDHKVKIRNLLMHTSGIRNGSDAWYKNNSIDFSTASALEEYVNLSLKAPLMSEPGKEFHYGMNNDICARIVEIITGKNFGDFITERIFFPLKMNSTYYTVPDSDLHRLCSVYKYDNGELKLVEGKEAVQSAFPKGNGNLVSTAGDYMNFLQMLSSGGMFEGKRLLREETVMLMTEDNLPPDVHVNVGTIEFPNTGFGLSVAVSRNKNIPWKPIEIKFENLFQHLPEGSYIWPGIVNTYFWVDPVNDIQGVVFTQSANPGMFGNFQEFTQAFYGQYFKTNE